MPAEKRITSHLITTHGLVDGPDRIVGGLVEASVAASTAITGATETQANFDTSYAIPANTLQAGTIVKVRAQGIHTATTGTETHTILLVLGSTTLCSEAAIDPANNGVFYVDFELVIRTAGATGTMVGCGLMAVGVAGTGTGKVVHLASTAVDTTGALTLAVAIDRQASATDGDSARLDYFRVEIIG